MPEQADLCPECGARLQEDFNFCPDCGEDLSEHAPDSGPEHPASWTTWALYIVPLAMIYMWLITPLGSNSGQGPVNRLQAEGEREDAALSGEQTADQQETARERRPDFLAEGERSRIQLFTDAERLKVRVRKNPEQTGPRVELADTYFFWGKLDQAREHYEKARETGGGTPRVNIRLGAIHLARGELERARELLVPAAEQNPSLTEAQIYHAQLLYEQGNSERAVEKLTGLKSQQLEEQADLIDRLLKRYRSGNQDDS